jgi:hypothetical protein
MLWLVICSWATAWNPGVPKVKPPPSRLPQGAGGDFAAADSGHHCHGPLGRFQHDARRRVVELVVQSSRRW